MSTATDADRSGVPAGAQMDGLRAPRPVAVRRGRAGRRAGAAVVVAALAAAVAGCGGTAPAESGPPEASAGSAPSIAVEDAVVRVPSAPDVTAGYLTVVNGGGDDTLTGVAADAAEEVQMHDTVADGDQVRMERRETVPVGAGETVEFATGGLHLMLLRPDADLAPGDTVALTLTFERSGDVSVDAAVEDPMAADSPSADADADHGDHG
jgi:copper(I)-binding protein